MVKRWVADNEPSQPPTLVLPHTRADRLIGLPPNVRPRNPPKHPAKWLDLAQTLLQVEGAEEACRTVRYLCRLCTSRLADGEPLVALPFHAEGRAELDQRVIGALAGPPALVRQLVPAATFRANLRA